MPSKILDSYALIAYLQDEKGADEVEALLLKAAEQNAPLLMTEVNYAEVKYSIIKKHGQRSWKTAAEILSVLPISICSTNREMADKAADFKSRFKLSLADAFAAAMAAQNHGELVTGDGEFRGLDKEVKIHWIH